jgi:acyl carrier protein
MDATTARAQMRDFVLSSLAKPHLTDRDDIFEVGEAPSLFSLELVLFLEEKLLIPLDDNDLALANFATIDAMGNLIERKLQTS